MIEVRQTEQYARWFAGVRDPKARARVLVRIRRLSLGNLGDVKAVGEGVLEIRVHYGPGYRVYFLQRSKTSIVLLAGGSKQRQKRDVQTALTLARNLRRA